MQVINEKDENAALLAAEFLAAGKLVVFATDTIYGITADASNSKAVERIYQIKKRALNKPIAIFLPNLKVAEKIFIFDEMAQKIAEKFLPGALTLVLETKAESSLLLASNLNQNPDNFIGLRIVDSFFVTKLFEKFNGILAVTSANLSGEKSINDQEEIQNQLPEIDLLVTGKMASKTPSTVAKISAGEITILRQGLLNIN
jgi:L-threonylcarbamoyladenylate synthase